MAIVSPYLTLLSVVSLLIGIALILYALLAKNIRVKPGTLFDSLGAPPKYTIMLFGALLAVGGLLILILLFIA